jgi:hypothetical protein
MSEKSKNQNGNKPNPNSKKGNFEKAHDTGDRINESKLPDFEYTPKPPKPKANDTGDKSGNKNNKQE